MEGSGIKAMIENDRYEDLTLLYQHISRIDPVEGASQNCLAGQGSGSRS